MADDEDSNMMKDVTVTSFGLVIAYLLPGLIGLYGLSFWSKNFDKMFSTFLTSGSNLGLFLIVVLASLAIGLLANGLRWLLFEMCFCSKYRTASASHQALSGEGKLAAYRLVIDETYRYHQWWGGTIMVIPVGFIGWMWGSWQTSALSQKAWVFLLFVAIEVLASVAARHFWISTVLKLNNVLGQGEK